MACGTECLWLRPIAIILYTYSAFRSDRARLLFFLSRILLSTSMQV